MKKRDRRGLQWAKPLSIGEFQSIFGGLIFTIFSQNFSQLSNINNHRRRNPPVEPTKYFVVIHQKLLMLESLLISCENAKV